MENGILKEAASYTIAGIYYDMFYSAIIVGAVGLIVGGLVMLFLKDRKAFVRPVSLWTFIAKLNYLYIPVCFAALFGLFGAVYSFQSKVDNLVDFSSETFMKSGEKALPSVDSLAHRLNPLFELKDEIYAVVQEEKPTESYYINKILGGLSYHYVVMIAKELGYPETVEGVQQMAKENSFSNPDEALLRRIPKAAKSYYWVFFRGAYWDAFWRVFPYVLIPVAEYALYRLVSWVFRISTPGKNPNLEAETSEFV
ncbi:MAG: hypothetical protein NXI25_03440 [bacterium]|nr:hypothetical protein [bacterium]